MRWVIVVLAIILAGWLAFDGTHALVTGDYVTPKTGQHAGQLGPWSKFFTAAGIDPRGVFVKCLHVFIGTAWLGVVAWFALGGRRAWSAMLVCAVGGLWHLPFGTLISVVVMALLFVPAVRARYAAVT